MRIQVEGLDAFRRGLRAIDARYPRKLREIHKQVADMVASRAVAAAPRRAKRAIKGRGTQSAAILQIRPRRGDELAVFMGQQRRSGWYGMFRRYRKSTGRQFRPWIGQSWEFGDLYDIGPAIDRALDDVEDIYLDELEALAKLAFPE